MGLASLVSACIFMHLDNSTEYCLGAASQERFFRASEILLPILTRQDPIVGTCLMVLSRVIRTVSTRTQHCRRRSAAASPKASLTPKISMA